MLASITPLGERGRQATWTVTVTAYVLGSTCGAVAAGALLGLAGAALLPESLGPQPRLAALALLGALAIGLDARTARIPGPRRQVDEGWLDSYRGWVYGLGFGVQLGIGVTTVVSSAATYVALVACFATGSPSGGALVLGCFGAVRGLTLLSAAHVRGPEQLHALHRRLERWREPATRYGRILMAAVVALALAGSAS